MQSLPGSRPVPGLTAGKKGPRRQRFGVPVPGCLAKGDHPGIIGQKKIKDRRQKSLIPGRSRHIRKRCPAGRQKPGQKRVIARKPAKRLQSQKFGGVFPGWHPESPLRSGGFRKGFLNQSRAE